jgi:NADPH-dependent FMN reductase
VDIGVDRDFPVLPNGNDSSSVDVARPNVISPISRPPWHRRKVLQKSGVLKNLLDIVPVGALQGKPVGIAAMGGSAHHYLAVDTQLRQVLGWFGALVAPTSVYLTGADFRDGALTSETARKDLVVLAETLVMLLRRLDPSLLGPIPLAAKFT